ncbi:MAG: S8 family peptidase [Lachnospiraceae bacterium]|jgi:subtilisin family serine protease
MPSQTEMILSQKYADFILPYSPNFLQEFQEEGGQLFDRYYGMIHLPLGIANLEEYLEELRYASIPKLFTLLDTVSLEASGILQVQTQPALQLTGKDVIIGCIDTGIDYTHPAFRTAAGKSRILTIWDQTIQDGPAPAGQYIGTEYTKEQIQAALDSDDPLNIVPSVDENGHGTFLAGVAAGSPNPTQDFTGVAPDADIIMVKLKEAKNYLKDFFYANGEVPVYQETDIMLAVRYLRECAIRFSRALIICIGLGTNQGSHSGQFPLGNMLNAFDQFPAIHIVSAAGNEAGKAHHYYGNSEFSSMPDTVEILVPENTRGFTAELWGTAPDIYSVGFEAPSGEAVPRIPSRLQYQQNIDFILEKTKIFISSESVYTLSNFQLIFMRFTDPSPGIWKISVYDGGTGIHNYHLWLPITGMTDPDITFLRPNPDTTLTDPANVGNILTTSTYNAYNNSLFLNSSRGYTTLGSINPDFASPGVDVFGPVPGNRYGRKTGASVAAAIASGAAALLTQWGLSRTPPRTFTTSELKTLIIRGAERASDKLYPNREWGYGTLDIYQIFTSFFTK